MELEFEEQIKRIERELRIQNAAQIQANNQVHWIFQFEGWKNTFETKR